MYTVVFIRINRKLLVKKTMSTILCVNDSLKQNTWSQSTGSTLCGEFNLTLIKKEQARGFCRCHTRQVPPNMH